MQRANALPRYVYGDVGSAGQTDDQVDVVWISSTSKISTQLSRRLPIEAGRRRVKGKRYSNVHGQPSYHSSLVFRPLW